MAWDIEFSELAIGQLASIEPKSLRDRVSLFLAKDLRPPDEVQRPELAWWHPSEKNYFYARCTALSGFDPNDTFATQDDEAGHFVALVAVQKRRLLSDKLDIRWVKHR